MRIDEVVLHSKDPGASSAFALRKLSSVIVPPLGVAGLRFVGLDEVDAPETVDNFWKISVFTDSVDEVRSAIRSAGIDVTEPQQFLDIGYLCHLHEPGGNEIELLQRTFEPPRKTLSPDGLSGVNTLGLVTLRVSDLDASVAFFTDALGMRSLAAMNVDPDGQWRFGLHFLGWTDDEPPASDDLFATNNREWLYQRPYTVVELQHGPPLKELPTGPRPGLAYIGASTNDLEGTVRRLESSSANWRWRSPTEVEARTPDGHVIRITSS